MRFFDVWIGPENKPFFKLLISQEDKGEASCKIVSLESNSLTDQLGLLSVYGATFEEVFLKLADEWAAAAVALREFAPRAQAVMDSGDATMTPIERTTTDQIRAFLVHRAYEIKAGPERERILDLAIRVNRGEWKHNAEDERNMSSQNGDE